VSHSSRIAGVVGLLGVFFCNGSAAAQPHQPAPLLTAAEADDVGDHSEYVARITYVARVPEHSKIDNALATLAASNDQPNRPPSPFQVRVSGEDLSGLIRWSKPARVPVDHLVLIDVGAPQLGKIPTLAPQVAEALRAIARAHLKSASGSSWRFRFIAGDERLCRLSGDISIANLATDPLTALKRAAGTPTKTELPLNEEKMLDMADLFGGQHRSSALIILAPAPPVWLPRESTEWLTRGDKLSRASRKHLGLLMQSQIRAGDAAAITKLDDWVTSGHLLPLIVELPGSSRGPADTLGVGVEEALARVSLPTLTEVTLPETAAMREYRGTVDIPLTHVQRPPAGGYDVALDIVAGGERVTTRETAVIERAIRSWLPRQLQVFRFVVLLSAILLLVVLVVTHLRHWVADFDEDLAQESRNATFVFAGLAYGLAASLVGEGYLQYAVSSEAVVVGVILTFLGIGFWLLRHAIRVMQRELALMKT
jgi:hypothetical protein